MHEWRLAPLAGDAAILLALAGDDSRSMRKARKAKNKTVHAVRVRPILPSLSFITTHEGGVEAVAATVFCNVAIVMLLSVLTPSLPAVHPRNFPL